MTLRVLFLLDTINRGGIEMQALDAVRVGRKHGLEITVVTTGGLLLQDFQSSDSEVVVLKRRFPIDVSYSSRLGKIIHERDIQVVQGHQAVDGLHLYLATRRQRSVKRVMTVEGFIPDRKNRLALKYLIPRMDAVVYPSRALQDWLARHDGLDTVTNAAIVANGADPDKFKRQPTSIRPELGIDGDALVIGMTGNFYRGPRKDQLTLIKALPNVFQQFPNAECIIVGGVESGAKEKFEACKRFCTDEGILDRVHFLGGRSDIPDILSSLDLFVFSSLHEGGAPPIAIIEAMFARVPVIASDIPPHREYLQNDKMSILFTTGDSRDLAEKIIQILSSSTHGREMADSAFQCAIANFSADARLKKLCDLYEKLLSS